MPQALHRSWSLYFRQRGVSLTPQLAHSLYSPDVGEAVVDGAGAGAGGGVR